MENCGFSGGVSIRTPGIFHSVEQGNHPAVERASLLGRITVVTRLIRYKSWCHGGDNKHMKNILTHPTSCFPLELNIQSLYVPDSSLKFDWARGVFSSWLWYARMTGVFTQIYRAQHGRKKIVFVCFGAGFYRLVSCAAKHGMVVATFYFAAAVACSKHTPIESRTPLASFMLRRALMHARHNCFHWVYSFNYNLLLSHK